MAVMERHLLFLALQLLMLAVVEVQVTVGLQPLLEVLEAQAVVG
jgi:hypothetical protein